MTSEQDPKEPVIKKAKNPRRYNKEWEKCYNWLTGIKNNDTLVAYCQVCCITLSSHKSCINNHDKSSRHKEKCSLKNSSPKPLKRKPQLVVAFKSSKSAKVKTESNETSHQNGAEKLPQASPGAEDSLDLQDCNGSTNLKLSKENEPKNSISTLDAFNGEVYSFNEEDPNILLSHLYKFLSDNKWCNSHSGGISLKNSNCLYMLPSFISSNLITSGEIFITNLSGKIISRPADKSFKLTKSYDTFMYFYNDLNAGSTLFSQCKYAVLATKIFPDEEFTFGNLEMLTGIKKATTGQHYRFDEEIKIPIIENRFSDKELAQEIKSAVSKHPETYAVLVRGSGVYIWGPTWQEAKSMAECYHNIFEHVYHLKLLGLNIS